MNPDLFWAIVAIAGLVWICCEACAVAQVNDQLNGRAPEPAKDETPAQAHAFEYALLRSIVKADALIEDELDRIRAARATGDEAPMGEYLGLAQERRTLLTMWRRRFSAQRQVA